MVMKEEGKLDNIRMMSISETISLIEAVKLYKTKTILLRMSDGDKFWLWQSPDFDVSC